MQPQTATMTKRTTMHRHSQSVPHTSRPVFKKKLHPLSPEPYIEDREMLIEQKYALINEIKELKEEVNGLRDYQIQQERETIDEEELKIQYTKKFESQNPNYIYQEKILNYTPRVQELSLELKELEDQIAEIRRGQSEEAEYRIRLQFGINKTEIREYQKQLRELNEEIENIRKELESDEMKERKQAFIENRKEGKELMEVLRTIRRENKEIEKEIDKIVSNSDELERLQADEIQLKRQYESLKNQRLRRQNNFVDTQNNCRTQKSVLRDSQIKNTIRATAPQSPYRQTKKQSPSSTAQQNQQRKEFEKEEKNNEEEFKDFDDDHNEGKKGTQEDEMNDFDEEDEQKRSSEGNTNEEKKKTKEDEMNDFDEEKQEDEKKKEDSGDDEMDKFEDFKDDGISDDDAHVFDLTKNELYKRD